MVHVQMGASATPATCEVTRDERGLARYAAAYSRWTPYQELTATELTHWLTVSPEDRFLVATVDGVDIATASFEPVPMLSDTTGAFATLRVDEAHPQAVEVADRLTHEVLSLARASARVKLMVPLRDGDTWLDAHWRRHGFELHERYPVVEFDLSQPDPELSGVAQFDVQQLTERDDPRWRVAHGVVDAAVPDIPGESWETPDFATWHRMLVDSPQFGDAVLLVAFAPDGSGAGYLSLYPARGREGVINHGLTAVHPHWRGHGVAKQLKLHSIRQARDLGFHTLETDNHEDNSAMRGLNKALGYRPGMNRYSLIGAVPA
jgi:GNAT superfamily N-acetyltransferase